MADVSLVAQAILDLQLYMMQLQPVSPPVPTPTPVPTPVPVPVPTPAPSPERQPGYFTLGQDPNTRMPIYECDEPLPKGVSPAGDSYVLVGFSGPFGPRQEAGMPIYAPVGYSRDYVVGLIHGQNGQSLI